MRLAIIENVRMQDSLPSLDRRLCVAPMMEWTDRHCRYFLRLLAPRALLYTEMVTTGALIHGDRDRLLAFDPAEQPVALQVGGSEPQAMATSAALGAAAGYAEINVNCGCPSPRVQSGAFGACLMREPATVADCVRAMRAAVTVPVTVKCRIGVDGDESWESLRDFVDAVAPAGCNVFVVHARGAWLQGLSPKQNREVPPLRHELVHRLARERPELTVVVNGGIASVEQAQEHLAHVDGVMLGREAYHNPWRLAELHRAIHPRDPVPESRAQVVLSMLPYVERELDRGTRLAAISRHMLGLFRGTPGGRAWRRHISTHAHGRDAGVEVLLEALTLTGTREPEQTAPA